jgi:hypothetical protein
MKAAAEDQTRSVFSPSRRFAPSCYLSRYHRSVLAASLKKPETEKGPRLRAFPMERMKGLEPSTFCMATD